MESREGRKLFYETRRLSHFHHYPDKYSQHYLDKNTSKPLIPNFKCGGSFFRSVRPFMPFFFFAFIFISVCTATKEYQFSSTLNYNTLLWQYIFRVSIRWLAFASPLSTSLRGNQV